MLCGGAFIASRYSATSSAQVIFAVKRPHIARRTLDIEHIRRGRAIPPSPRVSLKKQSPAFARGLTGRVLFPRGVQGIPSRLCYFESVLSVYQARSAGLAAHCHHSDARRTMYRLSGSIFSSMTAHAYGLSSSVA